MRIRQHVNPKQIHFEKFRGTMPPFDGRLVECEIGCADAQFLFDGVKLMREVAASQHLKSVVTSELHPADAARSDEDLWRELPNRATTVYHPVGTCRMGSDERAVVDPLLRVRGIEGLRVADAAIMPNITGGNTNAPAMMIGERCAELMVQRLQQAAE